MGTKTDCLHVTIQIFDRTAYIGRILAQFYRLQRYVRGSVFQFYIVLNCGFYFKNFSWAYIGDYIIFMNNLQHAFFDIARLLTIAPKRPYGQFSHSIIDDFMILAKVGSILMLMCKKSFSQTVKFRTDRQILNWRTQKLLLPY